MNPLISIIVPVYNVEAYLHQCIDSILAQTYRNLEIILVDDGSPDNCPKICDEYAALDDRIRVIHKKNGGLSDARNAGLDAAQGEYIGFVDSDDWIEPDMFEYLYHGISTLNTQISVCGVVNVTEFRREIRQASADVIYPSAEALNELFFDRMENYAWNKLYAAKTWRNVRFPRGLNFEDILTIYKTFERAGRIAVLRDAKYYYRIRSDSISGSRDFPNRLHIYRAFMQRYEDVAPRMPQYRAQLFRRFRNWYIHELSEQIVRHVGRRGENLILLKEMAPFVNKYKDELAKELKISKLEKQKWDAFAKGTIEGCEECLKYHKKIKKKDASKKKIKKRLGL